MADRAGRQLAASPTRRLLPRTHAGAAAVYSQRSGLDVGAIRKLRTPAPTGRYLRGRPRGPRMPRGALPIGAAAVAGLWLVWFVLSFLGVPGPPGGAAVRGLWPFGGGWAPPQPAAVDGVGVVSATTLAELANSAARELLDSAPVAVAIRDGEPDAVPAGAWLAARLRAPLLVDADAGLLAELGVETVVVVGQAREPTGVTSVRRVPLTVSDRGDRPAAPTSTLHLRDLLALEAPPAADISAVRGLLRAAARHAVEPPRHGVVVRAEDPLAIPAMATAVGAGHTLVGLLADDPRAPGALDTPLPGGSEDGLWLVGSAQAWAGQDLDQATWQLQVVRRGLEIPGGGQLLFPGRTLIALYGTPQTASLGVLGEQDAAAAVARAQELAAEYAPHVQGPAVPSFEIITTIASSDAGPAGDYSRPVPLDVIEEWVDAAGSAGMYVALDLQPGRTDFLTQAKRLEQLLTRPYVGLALDPEWRLAPDQVHLEQIGQVDVAEVNAVAAWLAELTRAHRLPQKLLLLHQFRLAMIVDREQLVVPPEIAVVIQMDGQGSQETKERTWDAITRIDPPADTWWGWKNFYDEDTVVRSPADTMAVEPTPVFVSYQ